MNINNLAFLFLFLFLSFDRAPEFPQASKLAGSLQIQKDSQRTQRSDINAANIVFKSTDGGQTWQNISKGLPEPVQDENGIYRNGFFADDNGLYLAAGNGIYHNTPNATVPFWTKETFPDGHSSIAPGNTGVFAYHYGGKIVQKLNGTNAWLPVYTNFKGKVRTVFETAGGTVFIGSDNGLFKSTTNGETWKQVHAGGWVIKMVEQSGVLVATSMSGIIQSADNGEHWSVVISEGGVGIDVARIQGGFAAITYNTASKTRRVRTSYDGGKTWQSIDAGLPASSSISTIVQVGESLFCGHPDGIYQSSDKGKTWKRILCPVDGKVYNLSVTGNVMYAVPKDGGC